MRFAVLQRKLEMLQKGAKKLEDTERRREVMGVEGQRERCKQVAVDIRELPKTIDHTCEERLQKDATDATLEATA